MLTRKVTRIRKAAPGRSANLKEAVLDAARRICFAEGVEAVSARKVARAVGCSATAIYLYYRNIDDLLHHLRMEGHRLLAEAFQRIDPALPPLERLVEMGRAYYRFGREHPKYYELMFLARFKDVPRRELIQQEIFTLMLLRDVVKEGIDRGDFRSDLDPMILANGLWSNVHGVTSLAVSGLLLQTAPGQDEALLEAVLDGVVRLVQPDSPPRGERRSPGKAGARWKKP